MRIRQILGVSVVVAASTTVVLAGPASAMAPRFSSCAAMAAGWPRGVGLQGAHDVVRAGQRPVTDFWVSNLLYSVNQTLDTDHDGVVCEPIQHRNRVHHGRS